MTIADRLAEWRNRLLLSARFQAFASAFPLTRPVARSSAADLFQLCAGFAYSQILLAAVDLGLLEVLREAPASASDLSRKFDFPVEGMERLVKAAAALKLAEPRSGGRYGLGLRGAALLGNPSVLEMVRHHRYFYADLADPVALLRDRPKGGALATFWGYPGEGGQAAVTGDVAAPYSALMAATQAFIASEILDAYPVDRHRALLDIGGGSGAFAAAAAARARELQVTVLDLPEVAALANARFAETGLGGRARAVGGDAFGGPLPEGADLVTLVRILHDHDDAPVQRLLGRIRQALPSGGKLLIAEPMAGTRGAEAVGDAYFGLYLWAMGTGRPRTSETLSGYLLDAGFSRIREIPTRQPLLVRLLVAG